jgi:hypothetical protein
MNILLALKQAQVSLGLFFGFKDVLEIFMLSLPIYAFSTWLIADTNKQLLLSFYGYCIVLLMSFAFGLQTVGFALLVAAPAALLLCITLHQKTLQKNFVTFKKMVPAESTVGSWHESLIRECLVIANNNKNSTCVLEQRDAVEPYLISSVPIQCRIDHATLSFITASAQYQEENMLIFSSTGNLLAANAVWKMPTSTSWLSGAINLEKLIEHNTLFYSTHFDAITISLSHKKRLFTVIFDGKKHENLSAAQTLTLLKKQTLLHTSLKEFSHVSQTTSRERAS